MNSREPATVSVGHPGSTDPGSDPLRVVVWVRGEHDIATRAHLAATMAEAARLDDSDIVVDLSGVTFMDASTIGAIVEAHNRLRSLSRSLSVRAPSGLARRLLDVCLLVFLIEEDPAPAPPSEAPALGSWVDVPTSERPSNAPQPPVVDQPCSREPARATARRPREPAGSVRPRRTQ